MKKVSLNDFISVYQLTVKAENKDLDAAGVLKKCQELYYLFNPQDKSANLLKESTFPLNKETFQPSKGYKSLDVFREQLITL
jgi:hypothetical protein